VSERPRPRDDALGSPIDRAGFHDPLADPADRPTPRDGHVAEQLRAELPGLGVVSLALPAPRAKRSPKGVREHLAVLSTRFRGADALALRQRPVPHAYRVAFRHVGLDPDVTRTPIEAAAIERLVQGGFVSRGLLDDALTIALVETGVPLWALDADALDGELRLRLARGGERLGEGAGALPLPDGQIVVADARAPLAPLFGEPAPDRVPSKATTRLLLYALRVDGVDRVHVEEALWQCAETLAAIDRR
jgi:DNA/RNA-binding domain of Phe-tRNA-synthetase-like protein